MIDLCSLNYAAFIISLLRSQCGMSYILSTPAWFSVSWILMLMTLSLISDNLAWTSVLLYNLFSLYLHFSLFFFSLLSVKLC